MAAQIIGILYCICKLAGQLPALLEQWRLKQQDSRYNNAHERIEAAYEDLLLASITISADPANIKARLDALAKMRK